MLSTLSRFLLDPFHILLFLILGTLITRYFKEKRTSRIFFGITLLWFFMITTPFVPYAVLHSLESRYLPLIDHKLEPLRGENEVHIIVLGSGYVYNENFPANSQLDKEMLSRLVEGVRLHHQLQNSTLIVSGPYNHNTYSQAEVARRAAIQMNVHDSTIQTLHEGTTTHEEAQVYFSEFYKGQRLVVVTSAAHMHRALGEFRRLGIDAVPSPTSYRYRDEKGLQVSIMPSLSNIDNMRAGIFEYAALFRNYVSAGYAERVFSSISALSDD